MTKPLSNAEKQAAYVARQREAGGRIIKAALTPEAAAKLAAWEATGDSVREVINRLLIRSKPPSAETLAARHQATLDGLADVDAGRTIPHAEVKKLVKGLKRSAG